MNKQKNEQVRRVSSTRPRRSVGITLLNAALMILAIGMTVAVLLGIAVVWYAEKNITPVFDETQLTAAANAGASQLYYYEFDDRTLREGRRVELPEHRRIDAFKLWRWKRLLKAPWLARKSNQSILRDVNAEYSLEGLMMKLKLQHFGHLMQRADSLQKDPGAGKD